MHKIIAFVLFQNSEGEKEKKEVTFDIRCENAEEGLISLNEMVSAHEKHNNVKMVNIDTRFIKA